MLQIPYGDVYSASAGLDIAAQVFSSAFAAKGSIEKAAVDLA